MKLVQIAESTLLILFEQSIDPTIFSRVKRCTALIQDNLQNEIIDLIPSYASILVEFSLLKTSGLELKAKINTLVQADDGVSGQQSKENIIDIPVYYHPEVGYDLDVIADKSGLSIEQVIQIHTSRDYDVYALGFAPGFAYLGDVDQRIACARKTTPRLKVHKGSVGIADKQTAVYPSDSPGGWQIIGRTPVELIDYQRDSFTLFNVGDRVRFVPIDRKEFVDMGGLIE